MKNEKQIEKGFHIYPKMKMSYKLTEDDKHDVEFLYKKLKSKSEVANKLNINYFEISAYIDQSIKNK